MQKRAHVLTCAKESASVCQGMCWQVQRNVEAAAHRQIGLVPTYSLQLPVHCVHHELHSALHAVPSLFLLEILPSSPIYRYPAPTIASGQLSLLPSLLPSGDPILLLGGSDLSLLRILLEVDPLLGPDEPGVKLKSAELTWDEKPG